MHNMPMPAETLSLQGDLEMQQRQGLKEAGVGWGLPLEAGGALAPSSLP